MAFTVQFSARTSLTLCTDARIRPILVVDEAHHLRPGVPEDRRFLTNDQMDAENRLCLLAGCPPVV